MLFLVLTPKKKEKTKLKEKGFQQDRDFNEAHKFCRVGLG